MVTKLSKGLVWATLFDMGLMTTSKQLHESMVQILKHWRGQYGGAEELFYWLLMGQECDISGGELTEVLETIDNDAMRGQVQALLVESKSYWQDVRYSSLEPVTMLWGSVVNALRIAAGSGRTTEAQKKVFTFEAESVLAFFRAARGRMEVAEGLFHVFRAMPAPECQAMAALLNVDAAFTLDVPGMCRLVRLLDHEGPMSESERRDLESLRNTELFQATFRGLRGSA